MHTIPQLLDSMRKHSQIPSDNKLSDALGVSRQSVSQWRNEIHAMEGVSPELIAQLSGLQEEYVLICLIAAESKRTAMERKTLRQIAEKMRGAAAILVAIGAVFIGTSVPTSPAEANTNSVYYGQLRIWFRRLGLRPMHSIL